MKCPGFVYAITDNNGLVKIGWSHDPQARLSTLRTSNAGELRLLGVIEGTIQREAQIHSELSAWHVRGEWFKHVGKVADFTANLLPAPARIVLPPLPVRRAESLESFIGFQERLQQLIRLTWPKGTAKSLAAVSGITLRQAERVLARQQDISLRVFWSLLESDEFGLRFFRMTLDSLTAQWAARDREAAAERKRQWQERSQ